MHWSAMLVLALTGHTDVTDVAHGGTHQAYSSYTQAWHAAHDAERPLLVILNPEDETKAIKEEELRQDEKLQPLLDDYVVAVIDTGTAHGKTVHELFDNAPLPRVVVIDKEQKKQIFRTSEKLSNERLAKVLSQHKSGEVVQPLQWARPAGSCPNCQKRQMTF